MRVCHVISGIDIDNGGPPVALGGLAAAQVRAGLEVSVLSSWRFPQSHDVAADWRNKGINVRLIGPAKEPMSRHPQLGPAAREMAENHDVFHIHSMWESIQHQACRAAQRVGKSETSFSNRDANWAEVIVGVDPDPANAGAITKWCKDYFDDLHPYSAGGAYV